METSLILSQVIETILSEYLNVFLTLQIVLKLNLPVCPMLLQKSVAWKSSKLIVLRSTAIIHNIFQICD